MRQFSVRCGLVLALVACGAPPPPPIANTPSHAAPGPSRHCKLGRASTVVIAIATATTPADSPIGDRPGTREDFEAFLEQQGLEVFLPFTQGPRICLRVSRVVHGKPLGTQPCFYRGSGFTLASEAETEWGSRWGSPDEQIWILDEHPRGFHWATDAEALRPLADLARVEDLASRGTLHELCPRDREPDRPVRRDRGTLKRFVAEHGLGATPALRHILDHGTANDRAEVMAVAEELGYVPLAPALVERILDEDRPDELTVRGTIGNQARWTLATIAGVLDGDHRIEIHTRTRRASPAEAQAHWRDWWRSLQR